MKKMRLIFLTIFIFVCLLILPTGVDALSYISEYIDLKSAVVLDTDEFEFSLKYTEYIDVPINTMVAITGDVKRKTDNVFDTYYYHYIIYYYNGNKEEIASSDGYGEIFNISSSSTGDYVRYILYKEDLKESYNISDIKYYRLFVEPSTKEVVQNYLYQNKKVNEYGIDPITDYNTVNIKTVKQNKQTTATNTRGNGEYALTKYDIDIKVNENNTFDITENISAHFNVSKHGIFRKIPITNNVVRLDGTRSYNRARINNINVNNEFKIEYENGYRVIRIGSPSKTITGSEDYTINYLYNIGKDKGRGYDEFYFNLIGDEWDTTISNITFTITMPKEFDESKLGFSSGKLGSTNSDKVIYSVDGNVITGSYTEVLSEGEALTVRLELPEGYFVGASGNLSFFTMLLYILPITFAIISFVMWFKHGRDDEVVETVEFYPPKGFNSAEVGFLYKGVATQKDVLSLLIYLADKGYIRIEEIEEKTFFSSKKGFKIVKLKEYSGDNINEEVFFKSLFNSKKTNKLTTKEITAYFKEPRGDLFPEDSKLEEVTKSDLYNSFYISLNAIVANLNARKNRDKIFEKIASSKSIYVILMIIATILIITSIPVVDYAGIGELGINILFLIGYLPFISILFVKGKPKIFNLIVGPFIFFHMFLMIVTALPLGEALFFDSILLIGFLIGLACLIVMIVCFKAMPKRTPYGNEMLGKIKGFKRFLETAEKPKLEALVMDDPSYFYNILPYTYVLDVSDKWIKKFEDISLEAPNWYGGSSSFNITTFNNFMNSTMISATSAMSSRPSSSGGSGGGSSGGGSGGGGGGSW